MTLLSDFQSRWSTQIRINASNPQLSSATSVDSTREALAAADAQADFEAVCGVAYSSSNATHVSAAVPLVLLRLLVFTGQTTQADYDSQLERLEKWYRLVLGRNRIMPTTNSTLVPTTETAGATPSFDSSVFDRFVGNSPGDSTTSNESRD